MSAEEALRKLREADRGRCAPAAIEAAVLEAFRRREKGGRRWIWAAAAAALLLIGVGIFWIARPARHSTAAPVAVVQPLSMPAPPPPAPAAEVRTVAHRRARPHRTHHAAESSSVVSQFVAVPYAPPLPSDEIRIVRVRVEPAAFGIWAVSNESREADVVAGADGIVRAVRWVR